MNDGCWTKNTSMSLWGPESKRGFWNLEIDLFFGLEECNYLGPRGSPGVHSPSAMHVFSLSQMKFKRLTYGET